MIQVIPMDVKYELCVYESLDARTDTNDTIIDREYVHTKEERDAWIQKKAKEYKGFKYSVCNLQSKTRRKTIKVFS